MFAQIQILARKFLSSTFSRFSDFLDQILAHDFGLNSFSAKIYFGRYIARSLYLFTVSIRMKEHFGCLIKGFHKNGRQIEEIPPRVFASSALSFYQH